MSGGRGVPFPLLLCGGEIPKETLPPPPPLLPLSLGFGGSRHHGMEKEGEQEGGVDFYSPACFCTTRTRGLEKPVLLACLLALPGGLFFTQPAFRVREITSAENV